MKLYIKFSLFLVIHIFYLQSYDLTKNETTLEIYKAIASNDLTKIKKLLKFVDVNDPDNRNWSLLHSATYDGSLEAMKLLVDAGSKINSRDHMGKTPLMRAIEKNDLEKVKFLVSKKANILLKDKNKKDAIGYAHQNSINIQKILEVNEFNQNCINLSPELRFLVNDAIKKNADDIYKFLLIIFSGAEIE